MEVQYIAGPLEELTNFASLQLSVCCGPEWIEGTGAGQETGEDLRGQAQGKAWDGPSHFQWKRKVNFLTDTFSKGGGRSSRAATEAEVPEVREGQGEAVKVEGL